MAHTGLTRLQFLHIFYKYCGEETPIPLQQHLYYLFCFFKAYPIKRAIFNYQSARLHERDGRSLATLKRRAAYLASRVDEIAPLWRARHELSNRLPLFFANGVSGSIDSFPIRVSRPSNFLWQRSLYNGKYKAHTVKVQAIVNHSGCIIWYSGPHVGVVNDYELFNCHTPPLMQGEMLLGDKGYCGESNSHFLITPIKNKRYHELTNDAVQYNINHARYAHDYRMLGVCELSVSCGLCVSCGSCVRVCRALGVVCTLYVGVVRACDQGSRDSGARIRVPEKIQDPELPLSWSIAQ